MIIYKLYLLPLIKYLRLDKLFEEDELRAKLLKKQVKKVYKTTLETDQSMELYVSFLLSLINFLVYLTVPYVVLESPCEEFKKNNMFILYVITSWFGHYLDMVDRFIVVLCIILVYVWGKTIRDAINRTNLKISPWIEREKYKLPERPKKSKRFVFYDDEV